MTHTVEEDLSINKNEHKLSITDSYPLSYREGEVVNASPLYNVIRHVSIFELQEMFRKIEIRGYPDYNLKKLN